MKRLELSIEQRAKAEFIQNSPYAKISTLLSNDIRSLTTAWCYYSGKIEGNTYTLAETEILLTDNITSPKDYGDAKMLKNLQNAFVQELYYISKQGNKEVIDLKTLLRLHQVILRDLVNTSESGVLRDRAVSIAGTSYLPVKTQQEIMFELNKVFEEQYNYEDPIERSIYLHCNIARIQPFIDGNKRTSRLIESIALMNADIIPVYSIDKQDILAYKKALLYFYETVA